MRGTSKVLPIYTKSWHTDVIKKSLNSKFGENISRNAIYSAKKL